MMDTAELNHERTELCCRKMRVCVRSGKVCTLKTNKSIFFLQKIHGAWKNQLLHSLVSDSIRAQSWPTRPTRPSPHARMVCPPPQTPPSSAQCPAAARNGTVWGWNSKSPPVRSHSRSHPLPRGPPIPGAREWPRRRPRCGSRPGRRCGWTRRARPRPRSRTFPRPKCWKRTRGCCYCCSRRNCYTWRWWPWWRSTGPCRTFTLLLEKRRKKPT